MGATAGGGATPLGRRTRAQRPARAAGASPARDAAPARASDGLKSLAHLRNIRGAPATWQARSPRPRPVAGGLGSRAPGTVSRTAVLPCTEEALRGAGKSGHLAVGPPGGAGGLCSPRLRPRRARRPRWSAPAPGGPAESAGPGPQARGARPARPRPRPGRLGPHGQGAGLPRTPGDTPPLQG